MKKLLLILFLCLLTFSCERGWLRNIMNPEESQEDTTPTSLSIISPEANATVSGLVTITAEATVNSNRVISNVNFFIDDVLKLSDEVSPWEYELNTFEYDNGQISIKIIAYDNYGDSDSVMISLLLDNVLYQTWVQQTSGTTFKLKAVDFIDSNTGWAVGYYGTILKTTDGGSNWSTITGTVGLADLNEVVAINSDTVFYFGTEVWMTTNGGSNISTSYSSGSQNWNSAYFIDSNTGYVVGDDGAIIKTEDGGGNWIIQALDSALTMDLLGVHFVDSNTGWAVGKKGRIFKTTDGGSNWSSQISGETYAIYDVHFVDSNTGWAVKQSWSTNNEIFKTTDGSNWSSHFTNTGKTQYGVHFIDSDSGWVVTNDGQILSTTDGGINWSIDIINPSEWNLYDVYVVDYNTGWAVGEYGIIYTLTDTTDPP